MMHTIISKTPYWKIKLRQIITLCIILSLASCGGSCSKKGSKGQPKGGGSGDGNGKSTAVLLVHGLQDQKGLEGLKEKLSDDLKETGINIYMPIRNNSNTAPISQQTDELYKYLKDNKLTKKNKMGLIMVCDSQGGVLGADVATKYKDDLKIEGIITNHSPLEGVPAIINSSDNAKIEKLATETGALTDRLMNILTTKISEEEAKPDASMLKDSIGDGRHLINQMVSGMIGDATNQGVRDMMPDSEFIKQLKAKLAATQIRMLMLGGTVENFTQALLDAIGFFYSDPKIKLFLHFLKANPLIISTIESSSELQIVKQAWEDLAGSPDHDLLVPLHSQLARSVANPHITRKYCNGYHHCLRIEETTIYDEILATIKQWLKST